MNAILTIVVFGVNLGHADTLKSKFLCKQVGANGYRPYYLKTVENGTRYVDYSKTSKGLLGQGVMAKEECEKACENSNNEYGVICSRTGLNGWKPTLYTGTAPGRSDFGYLGGSSIMKFQDCLMATKNSSKKGVCNWGGSGWWISPIDREAIAGGPFSTVDQCILFTKG